MHKAHKNVYTCSEEKSLHKPHLSNTPENKIVLTPTENELIQIHGGEKQFVSQRVMNNPWHIIQQNDLYKDSTWDKLKRQ